MKTLRPLAVFKLAALLAVLALAGCTIKTRFYSKTGRVYPQVAHRAVIVDDEEAKHVMARGGHIIGTIDAESVTIQNSVKDVNLKAAEAAAQVGGTHIIIARAERDSYTRYHPATETRSCQRTEDGRTCQTTYEEAGTSSYSLASGEYVVIRLEPPQWAYLPPELQPMP